MKTDGFYIIHRTKDLDNLITVLKDGHLKPGKLVEEKRRFFAGDVPLDNIYGNINFDDLDNVIMLDQFTFIFHPKVVYKYGTTFYRLWGGPDKWTVEINKTDTKKTKNDKLKIIKSHLQNPDFYPEHFGPSLGLQAHQVVFDTSIPLKDNLIGVVCTSCSDKNAKKIKNILAKKYPSAKFIRVYEKLPKLDELL